MNKTEQFPSTEDWEELREEWENQTVIPEPTPRGDFGTPIEPDWDSLLEG